MVDLPDPNARTADAIHRWHADSAEEWRRPHLGASVIGRPCSRHLWYVFRWAARPDISGRMVRLMRRGGLEESRIVAELRAVGIEVWDRDPDTGRQFRVSFLGGHMAGSCDGVVLGVPEAPKTPHLLEVKTSNEKRFRALREKGVQAEHPEHYAQMQVYMLGLNLTRALYLAVNKNDDDIHEERVVFARTHAEAMVEKARAIFASDDPPQRISEDPSWWQCKFCDHYSICHQQDVASIERNCRTCLSSTPRPDGTWWCDKHQKTLSEPEQKIGCDQHLFVPGLLPWPTHDADEEKRFVRYAAPGGMVLDRGRNLYSETAPVQPSAAVLGGGGG